MKITEEDIKFLNTYYPDLVIDEKQNQVQGTVSFLGIYNSFSDKFLGLPIGVISDFDGIELSISNKVVIQIREKDDQFGLKLPRLFVEENEIPKTLDRHFNQHDNSACTCGPLEEEKFWNNQISFTDYFNQLVLSFLYAQKYFDKFNKWPWGEYGHGYIGVLESYQEHQDISCLERCLFAMYIDKVNWPKINQLLNSKVPIKSHNQCICGSGKTYRECHLLLLYGLNVIRVDFHKYKKEQLNKMRIVI